MCGSSPVMGTCEEGKHYCTFGYSHAICVCMYICLCTQRVRLSREKLFDYYKRGCMHSSRCEVRDPAAVTQQGLVLFMSVR